MHPPGDGRLRHPEGASRFRMGQVLPDNKNNGVAQQRIEPRELARKPTASIGIAAIRSRRQAGQDRQPLPQACQRETAPAMVAAGIHDNAGEPGREFGLALEAADLLDQRAADVLRDVFRMRARSGHPPGDAVNAVVVPTQQGLERIAIAARGTVDEIAVGVERGAIATGAGNRIAPSSIDELSLPFKGSSYR
jgi:hypothetical protein